MLRLNHELLHVSGVIVAFDRDVLKQQKNSEARAHDLHHYKQRLIKIYFPWEQEITERTIQDDGRFTSYPDLKKALSIIFSSDSILDISEQLRKIISQEQPDHAKYVNEWMFLKQKYGYFENRDELIPLFKKLSEACRAMSILIECSFDNDEVPYVCAYKLMVLFAHQTPAPSFDKICKMTENLLKDSQSYHLHNVYYDVIYNQIELPLAARIQDLSGWLDLLNGCEPSVVKTNQKKHNSFAWLKYFAMAPEIEKKILWMQRRKVQFFSDSHVSSIPSSLKEAKSIACLCSYRRAYEHIEFAKICATYGVSANLFEQGLDYLKSINWPIKTQDNLPNIQVIGQNDALGYCWVKLPSDDLRALILGWLTGCCQNIGDLAEDCVKSGIAYPHHGFYVLLRRKKEASVDSLPYLGSKINDTDFDIIGQSYAWISMAHNLTLDSFEYFHERASVHVIEAILRQFAQQVLDSTEIKRVTLGCGGRTPQFIHFPRVEICEQISYGERYVDSNHQYCIGSKSRFSFAEMNAWVDGLELDTGFKNVLVFLADYLTDKELLPSKLQELIQTCPDIMKDFDFSALFKLLSITKKPSLDDLFYTRCTILLKFPQLERAEKLSRLSISQMGWAWALTDPRDLADILCYLPQKEASVILHAHVDVFYRVFGYPALLRNLLQILSRSELVFIMSRRDASDQNQTLLHLVLPFPEALQVFLEQNIPDLAILVMIKNAKQNTVLHEAVAYPQSLKKILSYLTTERCTQAIMQKNNEGDTVLHCAIRNINALKVLFHALAGLYDVAWFKTKNQKKCTPLHLAMIEQHYDAFKLLLGKILQDDLLCLLFKERDVYNHTVFNYILNAPLILEETMRFFSSSMLDQMQECITNNVYRNKKIMMSGRINTFLSEEEFTQENTIRFNP